ncbi:hypothetical protein O7635_01625 [Asanoa sp. WMMD1127]|uniref:hypothetical protein n=1 Tax=Asanoa sp. WMMD1127 TaxID=3016107 RepID=UPI0024169C81|nr:hypothetical protein [Asanoa sp. WMMD1127]MDG4820552.1 hypothetical protein [Asanoa sp. WMMD1127]
MEIRGINYDTGQALDDYHSRPAFDDDDVRRDMAAIAGDLHATAVRITGDDPDRILAAGRHATAAGLDVWFSPFPYDLGAEELLDHLSRAADRAEELRRAATTEVVLVLGGELTLFAKGFVAGQGLAGRAATMSDPRTWASGAATAGFDRARAVQRETVTAARRAFQGRLTYAAGAWEQVEWDQFDIVSVNAYRDQGNAARYAADLRAYHRFGRPVVVTEFGCCTYRGAADRGGLGWTIVGEDRTIPPEYARSEPEQVRYLHELDAVFDAERIAGAFWFTFAGFALPHRPEDPAHDLDTVSYGVVAVRPDGGWEPKLAFHALAALRQPAR